MNKTQALNWLVENATKWPTFKEATAASPKGWAWGASDGSIRLYKLATTEMYDDCHIAQQEWLDWEGRAKGGFISQVQLGKVSFVQFDDTPVITPYIKTTTPKKIYIAGPMTGYENFNREAFNVAADMKRWQGNIVLNPAILPKGLTQAEYMQICLPMVMCADAIYLLKGWDESKGAMAELSLAEKLDLEVIEERDNG